MAETLSLIAEVMGADRPVCVAREMSKKFERFYRGAAGELHEYFAADNPRGEVTLVIAGAAPNVRVWTAEQVQVRAAGKIGGGRVLI